MTLVLRWNVLNDSTEYLMDRDNAVGMVDLIEGALSGGNRSWRWTVSAAAAGCSPSHVEGVEPGRVEAKKQVVTTYRRLVGADRFEHASMAR